MANLKLINRRECPYCAGRLQRHKTQRWRWRCEDCRAQNGMLAFGRTVEVIGNDAAKILRSVFR